MKQRNEQLSSKVQAEAKKIVIPAAANFTNVSVIIGTPGTWYGGNGEIHVCGTVPTTNDMNTVLRIVEGTHLAFPVSWELRLNGEEAWVAFARPEMKSKLRMDQLRSCVVSRLFGYWGLSPLLFPAAILALFGVAQTTFAKRILDGVLLAWGLWLLTFERVDGGYWFWPYFLDKLWLVLPVALAWAFITKTKYLADVTIRLWFLIPCSVPIVADALYAPLNAGYLVQRFGCGCKLQGMNTNHITLAFAALVWFVSLAVTPAISRGNARKIRIIHFILCGVLTFWLSRCLMYGNMWL
jgi:hypothetical protein